MKRNERTIYNKLRKTVNAGTIAVQIPVDFTEEAKQAIHELLTVGKDMYAARVAWTFDDSGYCILYIPCKTAEQHKTRQQQESKPFSAVYAELRVSDYAWNGHKKPAEEAEETEKPAKEAEKAAAAEAKKLQALILDTAGGAAYVETDDYHVMIDSRSRTTLDTATLKKDFPDIVKEYGKTTTYNVITAKAKAAHEKRTA